MTAKINLTKLKPCNQVWDDMPSCQSNSRLCSKCSKEIIDFRGLSDIEIAQIHIQSKQSVCGIYDPSHFRSPFKPINWIRNRNKLLAFSIFGLVSTSHISGQTTPAEKIFKTDSKNQHDSIGNQESNFSDITKNTNKRQKSIQGVLTDSNNEALIGCSIFIQETNEGTITDMDGHFKLILKDILTKQDTFKLHIQYVGFQDTTLTILSSQFQEQDSIFLDVQLSEGKYSEELIFYVRKRYFYERWWHRMKRFIIRKN